MQEVTGQRREINRLLQKKTALEDDGALMKELTTLHKQLKNKNQLLEVGGRNLLRQSGPPGADVSA